MTIASLDCIKHTLCIGTGGVAAAVVHTSVQFFQRIVIVACIDVTIAGNMALKAPLVTQNSGQKCSIVFAQTSANSTSSSHHAQGSAVKRALKGTQVDLTQCLFIHKDAQTGTLSLLVIARHVLDANDAAYALGSLCFIIAVVVVQRSILAPVLTGTTAVGMTVQVAGTIPDLILAIQSADKTLIQTTFLVHIRVPCTGGQRMRNELDRTTCGVGIIIALGVAGHIQRRDRVGALGIGNGVAQLLDRELIQELVPGLIIVIIHIDHVGEFQAIVGPLRKVVHAGGIGRLLIIVVGNGIHHLLASIQLDLFRPGALPVVAGHVGVLVAIVVVQVGIVKGIGHLVTSLRGNAVGLGIHGLLVPGVGLGSVAVSGHAVGSGVSLGCQNVVQRIVGITADGQVVVACAEDVGLGTVGVVTSKEVAADRDLQRLACTGLQQIRLIVVHQLDGRFFHLILLLVITIRSLCVDFHNMFTGHVTGVGHSDLDVVGVGGSIVLHAVQCFVKSGVAQAVAEGIAHFLGVVPAVAAVEGAGGAVGITGIHDGILVAGLIVLVAYIDTLTVDDVVINIFIAVDLIVVVQFCGIAPGAHAFHTTVDYGRSRQGIGSVGVHGTARGVHGTIQHLCNGLTAVASSHTGQQAGIDIVLIQETQFHLELGSDDDHDGLKHTGLLLCGQIFDQSLLVGGQIHHSASGAIGVGVIGSVLIHVVALAAVSGEHDYGCIVVIALPAALVFFHISNTGLRYTAGTGGVHALIDIIAQSGVDIAVAKFALHGADKVHIGVIVRAVGLVDGRIDGSIAEQGDFRIFCQRKCTVCIFQQSDAFRSDFLVSLGSIMVDLNERRVVVTVIVGPVNSILSRSAYGFGILDVQIGVDPGRISEGQSGKRCAEQHQ